MSQASLAESFTLGLPPSGAASRDVVETKYLNKPEILALFRKEILAIRVKNFSSHEVCEHISHEIISRAESYSNASDIGRLNIAFSEGELREKYYSQISRANRAIREASWPFGFPLDTFRAELGDIWQIGLEIEHFEGRFMQPGQARVFKNGAEAEPHVDRASWDAPDSFRAKEVRGQLAINIYTQVPEEGGELELWKFEPTPAEYQELKIQGSYGLRREALPEPDLVIKPEVGELILINPNRVHAVRPSYGVRVTLSMFLGYFNTTRPLTIWS